MNADWQSVSFAELITERKGRFDPNAEEITGLPSIKKIDFSEGKIHLGKYEPTKTQQIIVEPGDFVFSGLNIEKGAAGFNETGGRLVVSANYSTCSFNDSKVSLEFFKHYMRSANFQGLLKDNLKKDYGFTRPKHLMTLTFLVPQDRDEQKWIVEKYERCKITNAEACGEITHQQTLLGKLKQAILQEAIQGKLTEDWRAVHPDVEPASQLLDRIQAEKARLIAEKKLRKEKSLPKITPEETPFEISKDWEWCRLGCLFHSLQYGTAQKCSYDSSKNTAVLRIPNVSTGKLSTEDLKYTNLTKAEKKQYSLKKHDVLMIRSNGSRSLVGSTIHFDEESGNYAYAGYLMRLRFPENIYSPFIVAALASRILREQIEGPLRTTVGINNVNSTEISRLKIPLPPLAEQAAIVERVEALMTTCRALEAEIEQSRTHAAHLLQAVLKEAFAPAAEAISHV